MKLYSASWHPGIDNSSTAEIIVEGLGKVRIDNCLSDETKERIQKECFVTLRTKLGQVVSTEPDIIIEAIQ